MQKNSNWCPEIYRSIFIDRYNDSHVRVSPCCQSITKLETVEKFSFQNSAYLNELRQKFDRGERPLECSQCWNIEDLGQKSRRQSAIEFFNLPTESNEVILQSIDHSATWACNLACIMCSEINSSSWAAELDISQDTLFSIGRLLQKKNTVLDQLDVWHVKKIHFNGGEPMLNNDQVNLLEKLDQQGVLSNVFVSYNTNGTVIPNKKIIDLWSRAKLIKLFFSIDAVDRSFEYIRYPAKWVSTAENLIDMKNNLPSNVMFGFNVTVGAYNILDIAKLYDWYQSNMSYNREGDPSDFCWQFAYNFDPAWLSQEVKHIAIKQLSNIDVYRGLVSYLKNHLNYESNMKWTDKLDNIDHRRGTNWRQNLSVGKYY